MNRMLDEIDFAARSGLYVLGLAAALAVPDIAGALESNGWASAEKYKAWFDANVAPRLNGPLVTLSGENCYRFRCSLLHQGTVQDQKQPLEFHRLLFVLLPGSMLHMNALNGALNLDVPAFCAAVVGAGRDWLKRVEGTEPFESNFARSIRVHPEGLSPFIVGAPVLG